MKSNRNTITLCCVALVFLIAGIFVFRPHSRLPLTGDPIIDAINGGDIQSLKIALQDQPRYLDEKHPDALTALGGLEHVNRLELAMLLLSRYKSLDLTSRTDGETALMISAGNGYFDLASELLRRGASKELTDAHGGTALDSAQYRLNWLMSPRPHDEMAWPDTPWRANEIQKQKQLLKLFEN